jgi:hypothetical protein
MSAADDFGADAPDQAEASPEQLAQLAADLEDQAAAGSHAQPNAAAMALGGYGVDDQIWALDQLIQSWIDLTNSDSGGEVPPWLMVLYPKWRDLVKAYNRATGSSIGQFAHLEDHAG